MHPLNAALNDEYFVGFIRFFSFSVVLRLINITESTESAECIYIYRERDVCIAYGMAWALKTHLISRRHDVNKFR